LIKQSLLNTHSSFSNFRTVNPDQRCSSPTDVWIIKG